MGAAGRGPWGVLIGVCPFHLPWPGAPRARGKQSQGGGAPESPSPRGGLEAFRGNTGCIGHACIGWGGRGRCVGAAGRGWACVGAGALGALPRPLSPRLGPAASARGFDPARGGATHGKLGHRFTPTTRSRCPLQRAGGARWVSQLGALQPAGLGHGSAHMHHLPWGGSEAEAGGWTPFNHTSTAPTDPNHPPYNTIHTQTRYNGPHQADGAQVHRREGAPQAARHQGM